MKKEVKIIIAVVVAVLVIVVIALLSKGQKSGTTNVGGTNVSDKMLETQTPEAAQATQELINEVAATASSTTKNAPTGAETITIVPTTGTNAASATPITAVIVNPGTSPINVETGKVITKTGETAVTNVEAGSQQAPQQSYVLDLNKTVIPKSAIKLDVKQDGFTPKEFTVGRGQAVSLVITNVNDGPNYEIFMFDDPTLEAVAVGVRTGQTKSISFNAPTKAGEYTFYSAQLNHRDLGAVGKMIVK